MSAEALARAQAFEAAGDADGAAREYVAAGAHQEAARVYTLALRPLEAAIALFAGIEMISGDLEPGARARAQLAASLLREGGRDDYAKLVTGALGGGAAFPSAVLKSVLHAAPEAPRASVRAPAAGASATTSEPRRPSPFVMRGPTARPPPASPTPTPAAPAPMPPAPAPPADRHRAEAGWHAADGAAIEETIRQFLASGRKGSAARVAWESGQFERALAWFVELDLKYQAGSCLRSLNRPVEALAMLLEVPPDDTRYRRACFDIVALARETQRLDFEVDRFLTRFVSEGPADASECAGFLELAEIYAGAGFAQGARRCAEGVLAVVPGDARAKTWLTAAVPAARPSPSARRVAAGDLTSLPTLDEFVKLARAHAPAKSTRHGS